MIRPGPIVPAEYFDPAPVLLRADRLTKSYGPISVLRNLSFTVHAGEVLAIIGPNGAGKTTLFRVLTGETSLDSGRIDYAGRDVTASPAFRRVRAGMGRTFQISRTFPDLGARDNLVVAIESRDDTERPAWYRLAPPRSVLAEAAERLEAIGLADQAAVASRFLSHGDKKRLELAVMLARQPRVLMMDEPAAGMSPSDRSGMVELLKQTFAQDRRTVLLTEHDMDVVFSLADRIMVLNYGEIVALGTPDEIRGHPDVRRVYLGGDDPALD